MLLCRQPPEADGKVPICRTLLCRHLLPSAADGKDLCCQPSMPLPSAMADGKVADSCSVEYFPELGTTREIAAVLWYNQGDAAARVDAEVDGGGGAPKLGNARKTK